MAILQAAAEGKNKKEIQGSYEYMYAWKCNKAWVKKRGNRRVPCYAFNLKGMLCFFFSPYKTQS